jgi:hypothetical protein
MEFNRAPLATRHEHGGKEVGSSAGRPVPLDSSLQASEEYMTSPVHQHLRTCRAQIPRGASTSSYRPAASAHA